MSFTDVMYGPLGQVNNQFQNNLGQNAAMNQNNQAAIQQQQINSAAQQAQLAALYGPQGFGGQTAQYAGAGAAYGRNTGGFGGYGGMNDPFSPVGGYNAQDDAASKAYLAAYPDVAASGMSAAQHYAQFGQAEGRDGFGMSAYPSAATNPSQSIYGYGLTNTGGFAAPSQGFGGQDAASQAYLAAYPDVAASGMSAAQHYAQFGQAEGRNGFGMPGSSYGPGYFDNTFGSANSMNSSMNKPAPVNWDSYFNGLTGGGRGASATDPASQAYFAAYPDVAASGMSAAQHYAQFGQAEGRNGFGLSAGTMAQGGDTSWLGAGGTQNPYNPFGQINSGQVGQYDPFGGYQAPADFNSRFGQIPGQPYGPGYFDQTFGAANSQGQAYNPLAGGQYPGRLPSDNMANQQQMIQDLYKTLGIIDNAGEQYGATYKNPFVNLPGS